MNKLIYLVLILLFSNCVNQEENITNNQEELPFIGKRYFETRHGIAGTGTPRWLIEIDNSGKVVFSFIQINQADKETTTTGLYEAGPFKKIIKCVFKEWDNETRYYEISKEMIYETDSNGIRLKSDECCTSSNYELQENCPCEGELYELNK